MKYAEMAYVKNPVSRIFFGTATSSALEGSAGSELLDFVYGSGITAFDTARVYGQSETLLGKWIERKEYAGKNRDSFQMRASGFEDVGETGK